MPRAWAVHPSDLSERITIQSNTVSTDNQGGRSSSWGTLATVWAQVRAHTTRESIQARAITSETGYVVIIRYRSDVNPKDRITWTPSWSSGTSAKTLEIHGVRPMRRQQVLELDCGGRA